MDSNQQGFDNFFTPIDEPLERISTFHNILEESHKAVAPLQEPLERIQV